MSPRDNTSRIDVGENHLNGIDTQRIARLDVPNDLIAALLDLPEDVKITSMHTKRGEPNTGIYLISNRFDSILPGQLAPDIDMEGILNKGIWDSEDNK